MAEAANPQGGANQEPPSIEQRMTNFLDSYNEEQTAPSQEPEQPTEQPAVQAEQPEGQASTDELSPDDIPAEEPQAQPAGADAFEIVHNGQQRKLSREETIKYAQQGFDYSQKMHAVGEQAKVLQARHQGIQRLEQLSPQVVQAFARAAAAYEQLLPYQSVDWVAVARENPLEYPQHRAQYDTLQQRFQQAMGQYQQADAAFKHQDKQLSAQQIEQESHTLREKVPAWRDHAKFEQDRSQVMSYMAKEGANDVGVINPLNSAVWTSFAYKAWQYDKLVQAKSEKSKQLKTVPPVTRPGASQGAEQISADKVQKARDRLKRTGSIDDAAALLLSRM